MCSILPPPGEAPFGEVRAHIGMIDRTDRKPLADPVLEPLAEGKHRAEAGRQVVGVAAIVEDQPVLGVENRQPVGMLSTAARKRASA